MSRQGLMDDSGYNGFDECSCYESCTEEAFREGYESAIDEFVTIAEKINITYPHANFNDHDKEEIVKYMRNLIIKSAKFIAEQLKDQK